MSSVMAPLVAENFFRPKTGNLQEVSRESVHIYTPALIVEDTNRHSGPGVEHHHHATAGRQSHFRVFVKSTGDLDNERVAAFEATVFYVALASRILQLQHAGWRCIDVSS